MALRDASGRQLPVQTEALSRWPDGSVRWLLVEFISDLPADLSGGFTLDYGRTPGAPAKTRGFPQIDVRDLCSQSIVWNDGGPAAGKLAGSPTLESDGPLHRTWLLEGSYGASCPFAWRARVHAFSGVPFVRIEHTLCVQSGEPMAYLRSLRLTFPAAGGTLEHTSLSHFGPEIPGPVGVVTNGAVVVALRDFAFNWPKVMSSDGSGISVDLFPELPPDAYADRSEPREELFYCFDQGR